MPTLAELHACIRELNEHFPRPGLTLEFSTPYDLASDWPNTWPGAVSAGVYAFIGEQDDLLYVGKASCGATIGSRLGAYFGYGPERRAKVYNDFYAGVRKVATLALPEGRQFEAPAIEEFLIARLGPPLNKVGRRPEPVG
jgi:hypothetical protein